MRLENFKESAAESESVSRTTEWSVESTELAPVFNSQSVTVSMEDMEARIDKHFAEPAPVSCIKPTPRIGQTCWIKHQVKRSQGGEVLGLQRADGKPVAASITAVYMDGTVRTGNSDIWEVQPSTLGNWETVNPFHGK